ncbi:isochorismate synthase MenF [Motiliproteus sp. SC1-56]|uniref:isochorismate synthase n=1 Tax=Motiliproteus sp. SC1-56 TaxID=2799565 RepID=UPI001A90B642|nr:isochorismate synthase [Motiliproteus sp. SC1-56]
MTQPAELAAEADLAAWLGAQVGQEKLYWRSRDGQREVAALGWHRRWVDDAAWRQLKDRKGSDGVLAFWISGFERDQGWQQWPRVLFIQPALAVVRDSGRCWIQVQLAARALDECCEGLRRWHGKATPAREMPPVTREDQPEQAAWRTAVESTRRAIASGEFAKVVLARRTRLAAARALPLWSLFLAWRSLSQRCYQLALQDGERGFLSLSPERLFRREDRVLSSEALAGTLWHSDSSPAVGSVDAKLSHEHALVVDDLNAKLARCCDQVKADPGVGLYNQPNMQHLYCGFNARLKAGVSDADLLACLHPTAAVCGLPAASAAAFIRRQQPFTRGWYAGCFGPVEPGRSEMAVAIRSGRVCANTLDLYAGAGIVAGSDPALEWEELERKIALPMSLFTHGTASAKPQEAHVPAVASRS